ncbi:TolC family protein [Sulfurospirillum sp. 1612]|uniref:TolC family protein n=1 Tax=Sulfurospirillum sp. 1612 TaxID=3094835 RepID=UPI002F924A79
MKKYIFFIIPIFLYGATFQDLIHSVDKNLLIQSKHKQNQALKSLLHKTQAKRYPNLEMNLNATRLKDIPTTQLHISALPGLNQPLPMGTRTNLSAALSITYPIFTGFAISENIEKAKLKIIKNRLETTDLKRQLYLKISMLYANIFTINKTIKATNDAKTAITDSYKKAKSMYDNGLINIANLYKIEAKQYEIIATLATLKNQKEQLVETLQYITNIKTDITSLPPLTLHMDTKALIDMALRNREDIQALKTELKIDDKDILLANSQSYPQIFLVGALKKEGDDLNLNGNGYTNADQSYIGATLRWNLFDGGAIKSEKEAATYKKTAQRLYLQDYERSVTKEIHHALLKLQSLKRVQSATQKELRSAKSYYELTQGRFDNGLISADELSRAIADFANIKAKFEGTKANIFLQKCNIYLLCGAHIFVKYTH